MIFPHKIKGVIAGVHLWRNHHLGKGETGMEHAERAEFTEVQENVQREITFQIIEHIGVLSETKGWKKELNIVSWNNGPARFEVREWDDFHDYMRKGLAFTKGELMELRDILNDMDFSKVDIPETKARRKREEPLAGAQDQRAAAGTGSEEAIPF